MSDRPPPDLPPPDADRPASGATPTAPEPGLPSAAPEHGLPSAAPERDLPPAAPASRLPAAGATAGRPRRRGRRAVLLLLGLGLVVALATLAVAFELTAVTATPRPVVFEVEPGWGAKRVATALAAEGLIRNPTVFRFYLRWRGLDRSIGEGLYELSPSMDASAIATRLAQGGRPRTVRVVIPEGWRAPAIAARLEEAGLGSADAYRALIADPGPLRPAYVAAGAGLEGYLFPASYELVPSAAPAEVLETMLARFEEELDPARRAQLGARGLSVHGWVTLASMVQAEAATSGEMPIIAGVFLNRLEIGMPLQSDPTVAYGLGKALPELDALAGDLRRDTPWNTYTRTGLPQGPIGNPGEAALRSVLEPVRRTDDGRPYLYFLHGREGDGSVFRPNTSLEAHDRDVQRYLRGLRP